MKLSLRVSRQIILTIMAGFTLYSITACRGLGKVVDDLPKVIDDISPPKVVIPSHSASTSTYKVVEVNAKSNRNLVATIVDDDKRLEIAVDCVTGVMEANNVIPPDEQPNFVSDICSRVTSNLNQTQTNSNSRIRVVRAGDGYANLRSAPSTEVAMIAQIPNDTSVTLTAQTINSSNQHWYKVQVNGQEGWIHADLLQ